MENKNKAEGEMLAYEQRRMAKIKEDMRQTKAVPKEEKQKKNIIVTNEYDLKWSIYEMLNNLDYALSGEEIEFAQADFFKNLKNNK